MVGFIPQLLCPIIYWTGGLVDPKSQSRKYDEQEQSFLFQQLNPDSYTIQPSHYVN
jgi:hypothetical protein